MFLNIDQMKIFILRSVTETLLITFKFILFSFQCFSSWNRTDSNICITSNFTSFPNIFSTVLIYSPRSKFAFGEDISIGLSFFYFLVGDLFAFKLLPSAFCRFFVYQFMQKNIFSLHPRIISSLLFVFVWCWKSSQVFDVKSLIFTVAYPKFPSLGKLKRWC